MQLLTYYHNNRFEIFKSLRTHIKTDHVSINYNLYFQKHFIKMNFSYSTPTIVSTVVSGPLLISSFNCQCAACTPDKHGAVLRVCRWNNYLCSKKTKPRNRRKSISRVTRAPKGGGGHCIYNCSKIRPKTCPEGSPKMYVHIISSRYRRVFARPGKNCSTFIFHGRLTINQFRGSVINQRWVNRYPVSTITV